MPLLLVDKFYQVSVKESADGSYILTAGVRASTSNRWNGYVVKINALTGQTIWEFDYKTGAGNRSGFETIHFTDDGGFIVGGYTHAQCKSCFFSAVDNIT